MVEASAAGRSGIEGGGCAGGLFILDDDDPATEGVGEVDARDAAVAPVRSQGFGGETMVVW